MNIVLGNAIGTETFRSCFLPGGWSRWLPEITSNSRCLVTLWSYSYSEQHVYSETKGEQVDPNSSNPPAFIHLYCLIRLTSAPSFYWLLWSRIFFYFIFPYFKALAGKCSRLTFFFFPPSNPVVFCWRCKVLIYEALSCFEGIWTVCQSNSGITCRLVSLEI